MCVCDTDLACLACHKLIWIKKHININTHTHIHTHTHKHTHTNTNKDTHTHTNTPLWLCSDCRHSPVGNGPPPNDSPGPPCTKEWIHSDGRSNTKKGTWPHTHAHTHIQRITYHGLMSWYLSNKLITDTAVFFSYDFLTTAFLCSLHGSNLKCNIQYYKKCICIWIVFPSELNHINLQNIPVENIPPQHVLTPVPLSAPPAGVSHLGLGVDISASLQQQSGHLLLPSQTGDMQCCVSFLQSQSKHSYHKQPFLWDLTIAFHVLIRVFFDVRMFYVKRKIHHKH